MKKIHILSFFVLTLLFFTPLLGFANETGSPSGGGSGKLSNPLSGVNSVETFVIKILDVLITFGTILAGLMIVFAGFKYVWARGNPSEVGKASATLWWTIVGFAVLVGSKVIIEVLKGTVESLQ